MSHTSIDDRWRNTIVAKTLESRYQCASRHVSSLVDGRSRVDSRNTGEEDITKFPQVAITVGDRVIRTCHHMTDTDERDWLAKTVGDFLKVPVVVPTNDSETEGLV